MFIIQLQYALAWGNLQLFDFNERHLNGKFSLYMWSMPQGMDDLLNPIGITGMYVWVYQCGNLFFTFYEVLDIVFFFTSLCFVSVYLFHTQKER